MLNPEVTNLILRFRDLVTARGGTINAHAAICEQFGYVWWAWWHKPNEQIPDTVFRQLKAKATTDGLDVILFDSGRKLVYRARCTDIQYDALHHEIPSPELEKTPEYYRKMRYKVWFKFGSIGTEPEAEQLLNQYTYVRVDEFFEEGPSRFTPFYDKQVRSTEELRQQDRTVWFVRGYRQGDTTHEVALLDARTIKPAHFPDEYAQVQSNTFLWVSDLHFSLGGHHNYPDEANVLAQPLSIRLDEALKAQGVHDLAGFIVSGDLTYKADPAEFAKALSFVQELARLWRVRGYNTAVVPGNHDVRFSDDPATKGGVVDVARPEARREYSRFYESLFYLPPNETVSCGRRFLLKGGLAVEIACLNSQLLDQARDAFQGQGFVGDQQLREAALGMGWQHEIASPDDRARPFRIVVVHHHIVPVTYREAPKANTQYSVLLDAEALARWVVRHRVNLVLHGHMHQPFATRMARTENLGLDQGPEHGFYVVGMGSTGIKPEETGEVHANTFGLIDFSVKAKVMIKVATVDPVNPSKPLTTIEIPY